MCWNNVDTQFRIMYGDQFSKSLKPLERRFIICTIAEEFPQVPRIRIAVAVDLCCKMNKAPITREAFLTFVQSSLR